MNKLVIVIAFVILDFGFLYAQKNKLDSDEFYTKLVEFDNALLFDIRVEELFEKSRLNDANWAGTKETFKTYLKDINKDIPIFIYCQIGKRTKQCSSWLNSQGFSNVYILMGGFERWIKNGYPVDSTTVKIEN